MTEFEITDDRPKSEGGCMACNDFNPFTLIHLKVGGLLIRFCIRCARRIGKELMEAGGP